MGDFKGGREYQKRWIEGNSRTENRKKVMEKRRDAAVVLRGRPPTKAGNGENFTGGKGRGGEDLNVGPKGLRSGREGVQ